jgi:PPP family 3-phenylpropionic acid transporter
VLLTGESHNRTSDRSFGLRVSAFYAVTFFVVGCYMPFLPVWLRSRGLTDAQISLIYAVPVMLRAVFTPVMTFFADRSGRPVGLLKVVSWGALFSVLLLPLTNGFPQVFAVILLYTIFWMSVLPVTDTIALAGARAGRAEYGRMRLWGSISYIVMNLAGGAAVQVWGNAAPLWLFIGSALLVLLVAYCLPHDREVTEHGTAGLPLKKLRLADVVQLVRVPEFWLFLAATGATQATHAVYYIFGTLHWTSAGIQPAVIGMLWSIGVITEIMLFAHGTQVLRRFSPAQLLAIAAATAVIRWTVIAFDPPLPLLFLAQATHGITFGAAHLGAMKFMERAIPQRLAASAQGLYASITAGVVMGLVSFAAGFLYRAFAGGAFLVMALLALAGFLLSLALLSRWNGGLILTPKAEAAEAE